jgi:signal transduction histidine kinase
MRAELMLLPSPIRLRLTGLPPLAIDAALAGVVAAVGIVQIAGMPRRPGPFGPGQPPLELIGLVLLGAGFLLVRSRFPTMTLVAVSAVATLYVGLGYPFFAVLPALLVALYSAVAYSPWPRLRIWALAVGLCLVLGIALEIGDPRSRPIAAWAGDIAWVAFAIVLGDAMRSRREAAREAHLRALQAELTREEETRRRVTEERLQIARELHDIVAHNLALINVQAGVAAHVMDQHPEQAREAFANIKAASHTALQELRSLVRVLRDPTSGAPALAPTVGLDALDQLVASVRDAGIPVEIERIDRPADLPATVDLAAYRILQEALTNVVKHTDRAPVRIAIDRGDGVLTIRVLNGPSASKGSSGGSGSGLAGMRERVAALGGSLDAGPLPNGGFRVQATLPVSAG